MTDIAEIRLRPYQSRALDELRAHIAAGVRNILLVAPTGSGKTTIGAEMMAGVVRKLRRCLFVVDRLTLLDQTSEVLDGFGLAHGIIQAAHWRYRPYERIQVASAQTLARRAWPDADLIIVDEAHSVNQTTATRIAKRDCVTIGLTATPFSKGLAKLYDKVVNVTTTDALIAQGFLSNYRIFAAAEPDMNGVPVVAGEWDEAETSKRALAVVGDCVAEYLRHADGKKFICSAVDVAHVDELYRQFMAAGVQVAAYTYRVKDEERADIVREFRKRDSYIRGLITVTAATKGFDVPDIECVIMARPLRKSLAEHIQFFGRGLRACDGKDEVIVLDHSGNCSRFWHQWRQFFAEGAVDLDDGKKREKPKAADDEDNFRKCPQCKHLHAPAPSCPVCGFEYPKREPVRHVAGSLKELIASGDRRAMTSDLWPQVVGYALRVREDPDRARRLALGVYKDLTDTWPMVPFERTEPAEPSAEVAGKIKSTMIRWAHRRKREERVAA